MKRIGATLAIIGSSMSLLLASFIVLTFMSLALAQQLSGHMFEQLDEAGFDEWGIPVYESLQAYVVSSLNWPFAVIAMVMLAASINIVGSTQKLPSIVVVIVALFGSVLGFSAAGPFTNFGILCLVTLLGAGTVLGTDLAKEKAEAGSGETE